MSTPIDRAAEALDANGVHCSRFDIVDTVLRAALTDPDDPDWLAIELHYAGQDLVEVDGVWTHLDWTALTPSEQEALRRQAARLKASILGGAS